jgi:hypothetical protein
VHVAYLWFKQYIKDACGSKEHQLPNICIMQLKHGNTITYWKYRNNRQLDLLDRHWNTNKQHQNTCDQKMIADLMHARIDQQNICDFGEVW